MALEASSEGTRFGGASAGRSVPSSGCSARGAAICAVPPGKTATPFHRHHGSDEMFLILSGTGTYRYGEERLSCRAGDCLAAPAGAEGHQIINTGTETLRYMAFSNNTNADVVEYLDSGRIRIDIGATGHHRENAHLRRRRQADPDGLLGPGEDIESDNG